MKLGKTKKLISLILSVLIILSSLSIATLAAGTKKVTYPLIYVHGFMASDVYADVDNTQEAPVFPVQTDNILKGVAKALPAIGELIVKQDWEAFGKAAGDVVETIFNGLYNDPDGSAAGNSGTICPRPTKKEIMTTDELIFRYDWRVDPLETAKELKEYIDHVLKVSGCKKVNLSCHSLGSVIVLTYLSLYGNEKVRGVAFDAAALNGESYTGDLLTGQIELSSKGLLYAIEGAFMGMEAEYLLDSLFELIEQAGLFQLVSDLGNDIVEKVIDTALVSLASLFANWLPIWAMVPDSQIDAAMDYIFGTVYEKPTFSQLVLKAKITKFNRDVRSKKTETLNSLSENARLVILSRYGYSSLPITPSWYKLGDGTVDTAYNSFGATTASFGETLSQEYLEGKDKAFISPDKTIDASTCLFPQQTWFIRNMQHSVNCDDLENMIYTLLYGKKEATVNTYKQYPRFLKYNINEETITPDDEEVTLRVVAGDFMDKLIIFFKELFAFIF